MTTPRRTVRSAALVGVRVGDRLDPRVRRVLRHLVAPVMNRLRAPSRLPVWDAPLVAGTATWSSPGRPVADVSPAAGRPGAAVREVPPTGRAGDHQGGAPVLRCLLVTESLDVGGMDMVVAFLARGLVRQGFATAVVVVPEVGRAAADDATPGHRHTIARQLVQEGVSVTECSSPEQLLDVLGRWRPDVASVHGSPTWALETLHRHGVPSVESLHGMHWLFEADPEVVRGRDALLTRVVSVSSLLGRQYLAACPDVPDEKVVVIPNAVDPSRLVPADRAAVRTRLGLDDDAVLVVSLARHCLQKNTYGLVRAFVEVAARHGDVHLLVTGDPSEPEYVAQVLALAAASGVGDRIHVRDHCPDPACLLAAADLFVLDSFFEGWALSSMEALCHGVPVVLSDVAGAREQLDGGVPSGRLVPNPLGDAVTLDWEALRAARYDEQPNRAALVGAMSDIVRDRDVWRRRRDEIAADARERFDRERCLAHHASVLREASSVALTATPGRP